jgi:hypothetical protein
MRCELTPRSPQARPLENWIGSALSLSSTRFLVELPLQVRSSRIRFALDITSFTVGRAPGLVLRHVDINACSCSLRVCGQGSGWGHDRRPLMTASARLPPASPSTLSKGDTPYLSPDTRMSAYCTVTPHHYHAYLSLDTRARKSAHCTVSHIIITHESAHCTAPPHHYHA